MRNYELTYIVKPDIDATNLAALIERVKGFVTAEGGKVVKTDQWGMRHLSYPIRRYRDGHYVFSTLELEAASLARIEQRLRLLEDVLRYLLVRADDEAGVAETTDVMGGGAVDEPAATESPAPVAEAPSEEAAPASG